MMDRKIRVFDVAQLEGFKDRFGQWVGDGTEYTEEGRERAHGGEHGEGGADAGANETGDDSEDEDGGGNIIRGGEGDGGSGSGTGGAAPDDTHAKLSSVNSSSAWSRRSVRNKADHGGVTVDDIAVPLIIYAGTP